jgi:exportin-T
MASGTSASSIVLISEAKPSTLHQVKDGIRDQCVVQISQAWYTILQSFHETEPKLAKGCLSTMARYISWIDISLVVNER